MRRSERGTVRSYRTYCTVAGHSTRTTYCTQHSSFVHVNLTSPPILKQKLFFVKILMTRQQLCFFSSHCLCCRDGSTVASLSTVHNPVDPIVDSLRCAPSDWQPEDPLYCARCRELLHSSSKTAAAVPERPRRRREQCSSLRGCYG